MLSQGSNRTVLFVAPTFPQDGSNGLSMRAAMWLRSLAKNFRVYLLVVPLNAVHGATLSKDLAALCSEVRVVEFPFLTRVLAALSQGPREQTLLSPQVIKFARSIYKDIDFDLLLLFRIYMAPLITLNEGNGKKPPCILDCDELESTTRKSIADLYRIRGISPAQSYTPKAIAYFEQLEHTFLGQFDKLVACSDDERNSIAEKYSISPVEILPNTAALPPEECARNPTTPFVFLFVGNMGYFPNQDGACWLITEVLPLLRSRTAHAFEFWFIGSSGDRFLKNTELPAELKILGYQPNLEQYYQSATAVLVPIRAGGGTRIKALEAFSRRVPVVSTPLGVAGLGMRDQIELLIANDAEGFADQCCRILRDQTLGSFLAENAYRRYLNEYSQERIEEAVETIIESALRKGGMHAVNA